MIMESIAAAPRERTTTLELQPLRFAVAGMLAIAVVMPWLHLPNATVCPLRRITGVPCPMCGMTRSVTATVHGNLDRALLMNPAGIVLVVLSVALIVGWRWRRVTIPTWTIPVVLAVMWSYQIYKYATGRPL